MHKQNLMPQPTQPVNRVTTGQLPSELAELSEETLSQLGADASLGGGQPSGFCNPCYCVADEDDAE